MKFIKTFENFKVKNITSEDVRKTIKGGGKVFVTIIKNFPNNNPKEALTPVSLDDDGLVTVEYDGKEYEVDIKNVKKMEYNNIEKYNENIKTKELFVRVEDVEGVLMTVQVIDEYGNKEFLAGGAISGHFARIGTLNNVDSIVLCEGIATALSIHEATGFSVVAVLTAQNYLAVAEAIRKKYPNLFFIFCADDDSRKNQLNNTGKIKADEARNKFDGVVAMPDFDDDPASRGLTDFNDMHRIYGVKRVREAIEWARKHNIKT